VNLASVSPRDSSTSLRSARNDISAVLLAGGESRRMGQDKATILFRGRPLWQIQLDSLRKLRPIAILVSARSDPTWRPNDARFIADTPPSRGPLSGLTAALEQTQTNHLLVLAIDMPFMTTEYLCSLCDQIEPGRGVLPTIGDWAEPLAAIYPREAQVDLAAALRGQDFSLQTITRRLVSAGTLRAISVTQTQEKLFRNINQGADLKPATNHRA
jgi:molybdopterin-guanine dinucleotide biosynthesis protein A